MLAGTVASCNSCGRVVEARLAFIQDPEAQRGPPGLGTRGGSGAVHQRLLRTGVWLAASSLHVVSDGPSTAVRCRPREEWALVSTRGLSGAAVVVKAASLANPRSY
jgi:hypothetical protein